MIQEEDTILPLNRRRGLRHVRNHIIMSLGFFGLFFSFGATQNLLSSILVNNAKLGYWSGATIYIFFVAGSLFVGSGVVSFATPKWSMVIGAITYVGFIGGNLDPKWPVLIPLAGLLGIGASILWTAQGTYMTAASVNYSSDSNQPPKSAMGLFNGIFFFMFQLSVVLGNLVAAFVLGKKGNHTTTLFIVFLIIAGLGNVVFLFLPKESVVETDVLEERPSALRRALQAIILIADMKMFLLIPLLFYSGLEQGFIFGDYTAHVITPILGKGEIGYVMAVFAGVDAASSFLVGKSADIVGRRILVWLGFFAQLIFFAFWLFWDNFFGINDSDSPIDNDLLKDRFPWIIYLMAGVFGLGDAIWNTLIGTLLSVFFTEKSEGAFANLKIWQSLGFFVSFLWGPLIEIFATKMYLVGACLFIAFISLSILDTFVISLNSSDNVVDRE